MFSEIAWAARHNVRRAMRRAVTGGAIAACALVAIAFATAAIYTALAVTVGATAAAAVMAGLYAVVAIALALMARGPAEPAAAPRPEPDPSRRLSDTEALARLVEAFLIGYRAAAPDRRRPGE